MGKAHPKTGTAVGILQGLRIPKNSDVSSKPINFINHFIIKFYPIPFYQPIVWNHQVFPSEHLRKAGFSWWHSPEPELCFEHAPLAQLPVACQVGIQPAAASTMVSFRILVDTRLVDKKSWVVQNHEHWSTNLNQKISHDGEWRMLCSCGSTLGLPFLPWAMLVNVGVKAEAGLRGLRWLYCAKLSVDRNSWKKATRIQNSVVFIPFPFRGTWILISFSLVLVHLFSVCLIDINIYLFNHFLIYSFTFVTYVLNLHQLNVILVSYLSFFIYTIILLSKYFPTSLYGFPVLSVASRRRPRPRPRPRSTASALDRLRASPLFISHNSSHTHTTHVPHLPRGWLLCGRHSSQSSWRSCCVQGRRLGPAWLLCGRRSAHLTLLISRSSAHTTHLSPLISHYLTHTAHPTLLISHYSSLATHLTPLISHPASRNTHHTALIAQPLNSHNSSHTTLISPPLLSHHSSLTFLLIPLISHQSPHNHSSRHIDGQAPEDSDLRRGYLNKLEANTLVKRQKTQEQRRGPHRSPWGGAARALGTVRFLCDGMSLALRFTWVASRRMNTPVRPEFSILHEPGAKGAWLLNSLWGPRPWGASAKWQGTLSFFSQWTRRVRLCRKQV